MHDKAFFLVGILLILGTDILTLPTHFPNLNKGKYMGMKTLTLGSGESCSTKTLLTGTLFQ